MKHRLTSKSHLELTFLYHLLKLAKSLCKRKDLLVKSRDLEDLLSDEDDSDIKVAELCEELISIKDIMPNEFLSNLCLDCYTICHGNCPMTSRCTK
ncbi:hypothetical protein JTB14_017334 [Gonioctena quinquepunctata]|nr:hypothetical protein JTB14_017334 [Gonioctena quinquepunctata]